jgi:Zn finger protein HypA/HybF involved in hydrogenase expression
MEDATTIATLKCERCAHEWIPRVNDVKTCPKCRSPYWNTPKLKKNEPQSQGEANEA